MIDVALFDHVQTVLHERTPHRGTGQKYRYQRRLRCAACGYALIPERQKGRVYYRCHTRECPRAYIREDRVDAEIARYARALRFTDAEWAQAKEDINGLLKDWGRELPAIRSRVELQHNAVADRLSRMTDAYVDGVVDKETYLRRKEELIRDLAAFRTTLGELDSSETAARAEANRILELARRLSCFPSVASDVEMDSVLADTTSNLSVSGKELEIAWQKPFERLVKLEGLTTCDLDRGKPRTFDLARTIMDHVEQEVKRAAQNDNEPRSDTNRPTA